MKRLFKSFIKIESMAKLTKKELDTRTFPQICSGLSNAEWLAVRDRIVLNTGKSEAAVYYWKDGKTAPASLLERKTVAEIVSRVLGISTNHRMLFPDL